MAPLNREDLEDFFETSTDLIHSSGLDGRIQYKTHNDQLVDELERLVREKIAARAADVAQP